ncbi:hypothetical protein, partial [Escherichia coli]|uniref:hypothetical protein n=1 Tax=Escherichia coli TaxID=562 RepID=UPI001BCA40CF
MILREGFSLLAVPEKAGQRERQGPFRATFQNNANRCRRFLNIIPAPQPLAPVLASAMPPQPCR